MYLYVHACETEGEEGEIGCSEMIKVTTVEPLYSGTNILSLIARCPNSEASGIFPVDVVCVIKLIKATM